MPYRRVVCELGTSIRHFGLRPQQLLSTNGFRITQSQTSHGPVRPAPAESPPRVGHHRENHAGQPRMSRETESVCLVQSPQRCIQNIIYWQIKYSPHQSANGSRTKIVSSRCGEVDTNATGHSINSSIRRTYLIACAGKSAQLRAPAVVSCQPGISS